MRFGISTRAYCAPKAGYRDYWFLNLYGASNQTRFLRTVDVHGIKFFAVREVLNNLKTVKSNENVDTVPREVWDLVRQALTEQRITQRAFAEAMQTKFCGSTMWKHSPSRSRLHRAAAVLDNQALHDLTTNVCSGIRSSKSKPSASAKHSTFRLKVPTTMWYKASAFVP
jgi:replicative DNA helicase